MGAFVKLVYISPAMAVANDLTPVPVLPTAAVKPVGTVMAVIFQLVTVGPSASCPKLAPVAISLQAAVAVVEAITGSG